MIARIYKPSKSAMQSGQAKSKNWVLEFEPDRPPEVEPLMGWTSSSDTKRQVQLHFSTKEEAVAFCERHGIAYQVFETQRSARRGLSYADNFSYTRRGAWTH